MKIRTLLIAIAVFAIAAFVALNWSAITMSTALSLGVTTIQAPLGFVLLTLLALFTVLFIAFVVYSRTSGFFKERNHSREMKETQELADNAETLAFHGVAKILGPGAKETCGSVLGNDSDRDGTVRTA